MRSIAAHLWEGNQNCVRDVEMEKPGNGVIVSTLLSPSLDGCWKLRFDVNNQLMFVACCELKRVAK